MIGKLKNQIKQKEKSKSEGELFAEVNENVLQETSTPTASIQIDQEQFLTKIKDEIQAWVVPQVLQSKHL